VLVCAFCACSLLDAARQQHDKQQIASWLRTQLYAELQDSTRTCTLPQVLREAVLQGAMSLNELLSGDDVAGLTQAALLHR
jgi:hypothetical protein